MPAQKDKLPVKAAEAASGFVSVPLIAQRLPWGRGEIRLAAQAGAVLVGAGAAAESPTIREATRMLLKYIVGGKACQG